MDIKVSAVARPKSEANSVRLVAVTHHDQMAHLGPFYAWLRTPKEHAPQRRQARIAPEHSSARKHMPLAYNNGGQKL